MRVVKGYAGTYTSPESLGVYEFTLDEESGKLSGLSLLFQAPDAKYVSVYGRTLAAPVAEGGKAGVCLFDREKKDQGLQKQLLEDKAPCYVAQDERMVYTANYHDGCVMVYEKQNGTLKLARRINIAPKAGCHQVLLHGPYLLVPCLELDCVKIFNRDKGFAPDGELTFPEGAGPRHGVFNQDHSRLYLVSERSNELFIYRTDGMRPELLQSCEVLDEATAGGSEPSSAAIRLSGDERYLYISTRGADLLTVFDVSGGGTVRVQQTDCGGKHPRDFIIAPNGRFLVTANRSQGGLVSFQLDPGSGRIGKITSQTPAPECVSIAWALDD